MRVTPKQGEENLCFLLDRLVNWKGGSTPNCLILLPFDTKIVDISWCFFSAPSWLLVVKNAWLPAKSTLPSTNKIWSKKAATSPFLQPSSAFIYKQPPHKASPKQTKRTSTFRERAYQEAKINTLIERKVLSPVDPERLFKVSFHQRSSNILITSTSKRAYILGCTSAFYLFTITLGWPRG